jgi:hypothetical protein
VRQWNPVRRRWCLRRTVEATPRPQQAFEIDNNAFEAFGEVIKFGPRHHGKPCTTEPLSCRSKRGHTAAGIGKKLLSRAIEMQEVRFSVAEQTCCLTAPDIFDHLVKSGCANIGGLACRAMQDFKNGVQR